MRGAWILLLCVGCAEVDPPAGPPPVALPTRDMPIIDPVRDMGAPPDMTSPDAASFEMGMPDADAPDADDATAPDATAPDATAPDAAALDAAPPDAQPPDASAQDAMPPDAAVDAGPECRDDSDCADGERCINAVCARGDCEQSADCDQGERCLDGACVPDLIPCGAPGDCPMGEDCIDGMCAIVQPPQCVDDGDCGMGEACQMGACVAVPDCVVDGDCGMGEACQMGECVAVPGEAGTCAAPLPLPLGAAVGMTAGASALEGSCGGEAAPELVFSHVAAAAGPICFDSLDSAFDTVLYVRDGDCAGAELACNDDRPGLGVTSQVSVDAQADQTVLIVVDGYRDRSGAVQLAASSGACGAACEGVEAIQPGERRGSTVNAGADRAGGCARSADSPDVIFRWRAAAAGPVCVRTAGSDFDTVLYVRTACDDPASQVACNDDVELGVDSTSAVGFNAAADTDYYLIVDGYDAFATGASAGNFVLSLALGACE